MQIEQIPLVIWLPVAWISRFLGLVAGESIMSWLRWIAARFI